MGIIGNTQNNPLTHQVYLDHHGRPGIQHIAFSTDDICGVVGLMRERAIEFLDIPDSYYDLLTKRLIDSSVEITQDIQMVIIITENVIFID